MENFINSWSGRIGNNMERPEKNQTEPYTKHIDLYHTSQKIQPYG